MLQWTGGRGGGHHSFEDFHQPILETYGAIRARKNIVLVAGSGFGGVDDTLPYITGEWSKRFGYAPMPFDGVLLGSRVMVAKEGQAADAVKEAIVAAPGVTDAEWEQTYRGPAGGIVTVLSEMGEPIHKIATRGVMFWKEMDDTIFSQPRDRRLPLLLAKKNYIIERLNKDFQKPWFGKKADGRAVDLEEMTYAEVANRLLEVLYVSHQSRWIDVTMRNLVGDYLRQLEQRFISCTGPSFLQSFDQLDDPFDFVKLFLNQYPDSFQQLLSTEDIQQFISLCMRPGQKPVPFIPLMDKDFHIWFKKDSLWQAEDIDAVAGQDVGRVCILQGPVAVRYSTKANEPVKDILDNIYHGQIASLLDTDYGGDESRVPTVAYLGGMPNAPSLPSHVQVAETKSQRTFVLSRNELELPSVESWLAALAGTELNWLHALLMTPTIVQHYTYTDSIVRRVMRPRIGQMVNITLRDKMPQKVEVIDASGDLALDFCIDSDDIIHFNMYSRPRATVCTLELMLRFVPNTPFAPIHEVMAGRNQRIKRFYSQVWFEDNRDGDSCIGISDPAAIFSTEAAEISPDTVLDFCYAIGNKSKYYIDPLCDQKMVPLDYAIRAFWPTLCKCLMSQTSDGDLLNLVHLSNGFRVLSGANRLKPGQTVSSTAKITKVMDTPSGRRVQVRGAINQESVPIIEITTSFLFRGCTPNYASNFHDIDEQPISLHLASKTDVALLNSKEWFVQASGGKDTIRPGSVLEFHLKSRYRFKMHKVFASVHTFGAVYIHASSSSSVPAHVGEVDYEAGESYGNPVIEFLKRYGRPKDGVRQLESDIPLIPGSRIQLATVTAPASNHQYSYASTDHNPIHTSPYFADYANLPGTITHGMWTSANARRCVEIFAAHGHQQRVRAFDAKFTDMVLPGDRLETKLYHVGMKDGCMLVRAETVNQHGTTVLTAVAEVEQPPTVFAFPGQGAHEQGMGMELYARSEPARRIWDSANEFMRTTYGIPLIDIVRNNPKTYTVHFVGERGLRIRENYRAMVYEYSSHDGAGSLNRPLFPEITENTDSFTFSYPNGLLYATQFTQPAILLCEIAEFVHLEASGIVPKHAAYAGHSLGEYAGLTAIANIMTPESAADLGFCRGLTMQQSVRRNSNGQSIYAMMAVSPARVGKWFTADNLETVVNAVQLYGQYDGLLEIVNYNVRGEQYVVSGELILLEALNRILEAIIKLGRLPGSLVELTRASVQSALHIRERTGYIPPRRTSATIPIHGIDVPFHSTILGAGVQSFRKVLQTKISPDSIIPDRLCGRYIPNLTARPFDTTKEYIENVYALTKSPFVLELIQNYSSSNLQADPILVQQVTYTLLIEILAYQFSSPVRWIETQDVMLTEIEVNRFIEVGPGSVLGSMLKRSLFRTPRSSNADSDAIRERTEILCTSSDISKIMFQDRPVAEAPLAAVETAAPIQNSKPMPQKPVQPAVAASIPAVSAGGGGSSAAEEIPDAPVQPLETIRALVAYKLKCGLGAISADRAIKDFVGGKSTVQNEIIGDLQKEFKDDFPEKPEEIPLNELAQNLSPTADSLGKHSSALLARMISSKMPGGYGRAAISKHLSSTFGLGPMRQCGLLLVALTLEPAARLDSESSAKKWLATVAHEYATLANVTYKAAASSSSSQGPGGGAVAVINSAEFEASQLAQKQMAIQQMRVLARYLGITVDAAINGSASGEEQENADSEGWLQEHGEFYADNFKPKFSAPMARHFDSSWNWARQDLLELYYQLVLGKITKIDLSMASNCLHLVNRLTPSIMDSLKFIVGHSSQHLTQGHRLAHKYGLGLLERCSECVGGSPVYQFTAKLLAPCLQMDHTGSVVYKEVERPGEQSIVDYVSTVTDRNSSQIAATLKASHAALDKMIEQLDLSHMFAPAQQKLDMPKVKLPPMVHLRSKVRDPTVWEYDPALSELYTNALNDICENGLTFANKTALLTGCGRG
ncbi:fatty acid synthase alpha subunit Lsd1, partial [Linderina pennispora]